MEAQFFYGFAVGAAAGAVIMAVWLGNVAHVNYEKYRTEKAKVYALDQHLLDVLEGNTELHWMMVGEGAEDPQVIRGRPDRDSRRKGGQEPVVAVSEGDTIDLTWVESSNG